MILVTGASGFVGNKLMQMCENTVAAPSLRGVTEDDIRRIVEESGADVIVHTAAISDIGTCQQNPEASYLANVQIPIWLAKAAGNRKLICYSSDQVYSGMDTDGPYTEEYVKPANLYAEHKIEMEQRVLDIQPDAVMLRAEWMYDEYHKKSNFLMNMLRAEDTVYASTRQYRGLTYVREVAENMEAVIGLPGGAYNFGSETELSIHTITRDFLALIGKNVTVEDCAPGHNLWMNCEKARKYGVVFRSVEDGLRLCAEDYGLIASAKA